MPPLAPLGQAAPLVAAQLAGAALLAAPVLAFGGFCAAWVPPLGATAAAFAVFLWIARSRDRLSRARVRALALVSGAAHGILAALAYGAAVVVAPEAFSFPPSAALFLAPLLGVAAALVAAALTLCAGDGAAAASGGFAEAAPSPPDARPARLPTRSR
jgi:hypothetical protein